MRFFVNNLGISLQLPELNDVIVLWDGLLQACFWAPNQFLTKKKNFFVKMFVFVLFLIFAVSCLFYVVTFSLIFTNLCLYIFLFKLALIFVVVFVYLTKFSRYCGFFCRQRPILLCSSHKRIEVLLRSGE
jgi:hypothetical protein